jgi:hypothetical protein
VDTADPPCMLVILPNQVNSTCCSAMLHTRPHLQGMLIRQGLAVVVMVTGHCTGQELDPVTCCEPSLLVLTVPCQLALGPSLSRIDHLQVRQKGLHGQHTAFCCPLAFCKRWSFPLRTSFGPGRGQRQRGHHRRDMSLSPTVRQSTGATTVNARTLTANQNLWRNQARAARCARRSSVQLVSSLVHYLAGNPQVGPHRRSLQRLVHCPILYPELRIHAVRLTVLC